jgi:hypothetical protein
MQLSPYASITRRDFFSRKNYEATLIERQENNIAKNIFETEN